MQLETPTPTILETGASAAIETHEPEDEQIARANASGCRAVIFLHGLWLLPSSWDRWVERFTVSGYAAVTPDWPQSAPADPAASEDPAMVAGTRIQAVAEHYAQLIRGLNRKPVIIGHSMGGLIAQMLAGQGLARVTVAIEPAPFRGVLPLPISTLRTALPVIRHPQNRDRAVPLSYEQFQHAFANALNDQEVRELYQQFVVPAPTRPLRQSLVANANPLTEAKVQHGPSRGPMLIIAGGKDQMFPAAIAEACYRHQRKSSHRTTEIIRMDDRGHSITIDHGWREVADIAYAFVERFTSAHHPR